MKEMRCGVILFSMVLAGIATAEQGIISVNWAANLGAADQVIEGAETYGVPDLGTVVGNWNNTTFNQTEDMLWDDGSTNTVGMTLRASGGFQANGTPLTNTVLYAGPMNWGAGVDFTIYGMANEFKEGFSVIVYLGGHAWAGPATITDGTTTNYWNTPQPFDPTLIQSVNTTGVAVEQSNYAVFTNLTANAIKFSMSGVSGNGQCIAGFQIVGEKGSFTPTPAEGVIIGWDAGITASSRLEDASGNMWGGPWPSNPFAGSTDGTFGTHAGATDLFNMATVLNNTGLGGNSDRIFINVGWTNAVPVRLDSMHFDIGRASNSFDTINLYQIVGTSTNLIYTEAGLPLLSAVTNYTDIDIMLTNISDNVLANGQTLNFMLVGSNSISNDANMFLDNTAFVGEPISHYEGWAYTYGDIGTDEDDPDGDGLNNFGEYVFGGNPTNVNNVGYQPETGAMAASGGTNYIEYVYTKRITDGSSITYDIEQCNDLVFGAWTNSTDAIEMGSGIVVSNQFQTVTNWIPTDGKSREFLRVIAE